MSRLVHIDGDWWPAGDIECRESIMRTFLDSKEAYSLCKKMDVVVQAGGNCGVWPRHLARYFKTVYTFEPDADNFQCLVMNALAPNIIKLQAALGIASPPVGLTKTPQNVGAHHIQTSTSEPKTIPMMSIDQLRLQACDLIALDIEGYEHFALTGAQKTISQFRPVIMIEEKLHGRRYGIPDGALKDLFDKLRYKVVKKVNRDLILMPEESCAAAR